MGTTFVVPDTNVRHLTDRQLIERLAGELATGMRHCYETGAETITIAGRTMPWGNPRSVARWQDAVLIERDGARSAKITRDRNFVNVEIITGYTVSFYRRDPEPPAPQKPTRAQLARDTSPTGRTPDSLFNKLTGSTVGQWLNLSGARIDVYRSSDWRDRNDVSFSVTCNGCQNPGNGHSSFPARRHRSASISQEEAEQLAMDEANTLGRAHAAVCDEVSVWVRGAAA